MPILQNCQKTEIISVQTAGQNIDDLLTKEWLLTNQRGGYSSSTIIGCNTRRYHGLLIGSLSPPVNRVMALSNCREILIIDNKVVNLSTFEFDAKFAPEGFGYIKRFYKDTGVHFEYEFDRFGLTKSVYLYRKQDTVALVYDFAGLTEKIELLLRPMVGLRDFHTLQKSYAPLCAKQVSAGLRVRHNVPGSCKLLLNCSCGNFEKDKQWWFNFVYRNDKNRGQDFTEDLWAPGFYRCILDSPTRIILWASLASCGRANHLIEPDIEIIHQDLSGHQAALISAARTKDNSLQKLCLAADDFIVKRQGESDNQTLEDKPQQEKYSILAGFPWFADWGRDSFISLPGLLLETARTEQAKSVLTTFAAAAEKGMIPNRFDDRTNTAHFNSVDASLWFINAAFQYLRATGDLQTFSEQLLPVISSVIESYQKGTRFNIHADSDGLITAGNEQTQLTWMDAKYDGVAFTPRDGKAVEINALWYNSLCLLGQFHADRDIETARRYHSMADDVEKAFCRLFWNEEKGYLNDCIAQDGRVDSALRPNQIFAVSLAFSPLTSSQQKSVVEAVQKKLLTPFGLHSLDPDDKRYIGRYSGPQQQRDAAYHQGTVWAYLIGPFVEAYLKVNDFSKTARKEAAAFTEPLLNHFLTQACLGSVSEIFDGDPPHSPRGCIAQAWSVAELIRAYKLINNSSSLQS